MRRCRQNREVKRVEEDVLPHIMTARASHGLGRNVEIGLHVKRMQLLILLILLTRLFSRVPWFNPFNTSSLLSSSVRVKAGGAKAAAER